MPDSLTVERVTDAAALAALKTPWNALLAANSTRTVELSHAWQSLYWQHLHEGTELFVLVVRDGAQIVGIAPLRLTILKKFGVSIRCLDFIASKQSNYQDYLIAGDHDRVLASIHTYLLEHQREWDLLRLYLVPEESPTLKFALNQTDFKVRRMAVKPTCYLPISGTWDEYAQATRSKRKQVITSEKRLHKRGELSFFRCQTREQCETYLNALFEMHRRRWHDTDTPSQFHDPRYEQFYLATVPELLPEGQINLSVLAVDETPIAIAYSFVYEQTLLGQMQAYNPDYYRGSPSIVLVEYLLRDAFDDHIALIDFGDYFPYKELWTDRIRHKLSIELYARKFWPSRCIYLAQRLRDARQKSHASSPKDGAHAT